MDLQQLQTSDTSEVSLQRVKLLFYNTNNNQASKNLLLLPFFFLLRSECDAILVPALKLDLLQPTQQLKLLLAFTNIELELFLV